MLRSAALRPVLLVQPLAVASPLPVPPGFHCPRRGLGPLARTVPLPGPSSTSAFSYPFPTDASEPSFARLLLLEGSGRVGMAGLGMAEIGQKFSQLRD